MYIKREKAEEAVWEILNGLGYSQKHNDKLVEEVDAVLTDAEEHGVWDERIEEDPRFDPYGFFKRRWYCSCCGRYQTYGKTEFCCHCGAQMEKNNG